MTDQEVPAKNQQQDGDPEWDARIQVAAQATPPALQSIKPLFSNILVHVDGFAQILRAVNGELLDRRFGEEFSGLAIDRRHMLTQYGQQVASLQGSELFEGAAAGTWNVAYSGGQIAYAKGGEEGVTRIGAVALGGTGVQVTVDETSEIAEEALRRIILSIYQSAGIEIPWKTLKRRVFVRAWKVAVEVDFGWTTLDLLHPGLQKVLKHHFPDKVARGTDDPAVTRFGDVYVEGFDAPPQRRPRIAKVDAEVNLSIQVWDNTSGNSSTVQLEFDREATYKRGTSLVRVTASTDYETLKNILVELAGAKK